MAENDEHLTVGEAAARSWAGAVFGGMFRRHGAPRRRRMSAGAVQGDAGKRPERWASRMKVGDVRLADVLGDMDNRELAGSPARRSASG
jgi:hypothetical protein